MALNLHLLRLFAAVAQCGNFSQAASMLYISQPAVSKGVRELERQLNTTLIDRSNYKIELTEAGRVLHYYAQQIFALEHAAETDLEQLTLLERGQLAVGGSHTTGTYLLPRILGSFHERYPGIQLSLDIGNTQQVVEWLLKSAVDIGFVEGPVDNSNLVIQPWRVDNLVIIAPLHHRLAGQPSISFSQLLAEPFITRELGSGTRAVSEQALRERGVQIQVAMELGSNQAIKEAVSAGLGLSIVSDATIVLERHAGTLAVLDVSDFVLTRTLTYIHVKGRPLSPPLNAFQAIIAAAASNEASV